MPNTSKNKPNATIPANQGVLRNREGALGVGGRTPPPSSQNGPTTRASSQNSYYEHGPSIPVEKESIKWDARMINMKDPTTSDLIGAIEVLADAKSKYTNSSGAKLLKIIAALLREAKENELAEKIANEVLSHIIPFVDSQPAFPPNLASQLEDIKNSVEDTCKRIMQGSNELWTKMDEQISALETQHILVPPSQITDQSRTYANTTTQIHSQPNSKKLEELTALTSKELTTTLNDALKEIKAPIDVRFVRSTWTNDGKKLLTETNSAAAADWIRDIQNDTALNTVLQGAISLNSRLYPVLI
ncbi:hypothetical protein L218DRAFT_1005673 [Marasmius fiardii PR-910]|nr:hypothetical protein L218DRAFT_1005673 [Marasmius fiardii PR-910]